MRDDIEIRRQWKGMMKTRKGEKEKQRNRQEEENWEFDS